MSEYNLPPGYGSGLGENIPYVPLSKEDNVCINSIEDQRKAAQQHYMELSNQCFSWSGFVAAAIKAYDPQKEEFIQELQNRIEVLENKMNQVFARF